MTDREMVIQGIQECNLNGGMIGNCPYKGIIDLLKEQEAVTVHDPGAFCPKCGWMLYPEDHPKFCGNCGRPVKWE